MLGHGLEDDVAAGEVFHRRRRRDAGSIESASGDRASTARRTLEAAGYAVVPAATACSSTSENITSKPARADTSQMPEPMVPQPTTPTRLISGLTNAPSPDDRAVKTTDAGPSTPAYDCGMDQSGRSKPWIFRTYAGYASPEVTNARFKANLAKGQTGLSVAFDLPTQTGYDSDQRWSGGGRQGPPISHSATAAVFDGRSRT